MSSNQDQTVGWEVTGNAESYKRAMAEAAAVTAKTDSQVAEHMASVADATDSAFSAMREAMTKAMDAVRAEVKAMAADAGEAFGDAQKKAKEWSVATGVAIGVVATALGVGALYTAFRLVETGSKFLVGLLNGEAYKTKFIDDLKAMNDEVEKWQSNLEVGAATAQAYALAGERIGVSAEDIGTALDLATRAAREHTDEMDRLGVAYKDQSGQLLQGRELLEAIDKTLQQYTEGWDRNAAAQALGFERASQVHNALRITRDEVASTEAKLREYNLIIGQEGQEAISRYDGALQEFFENAKLTSQGFSKVIADVTMPVLTDLAIFFKEGFPGAVAVFRYTMATIATLMQGVSMSIKIAIEIIKAAWNELTTSVSAAGQVLWKAAHGDFAGAVEVMKKSSRDADDAWSKAFANMEADAIQTQKNIAQAWQLNSDLGSLGSDGEKTLTKKGKTFVKAEKPKEEKEVAEPSFMKYYEAALAEEKRLATERDAIHGMSKEAELQFWRDLQQYAVMSEVDKAGVARKASEARIEVLRQEAQQADQVGRTQLEQFRDRQLARVDLEEQEVQTRAALGQITQRELLQQEQEFERRRLEIRREAIAASLAALDPARDPVEVAQLNAQLEALEDQHQKRMAQLVGQVALEQNKIWTDLGSSMTRLWDQGVQAMMNKTLTWRGAVKATMTELTMWFAKSVVGDMVKKWAAGKAAQLAASLAGLSAEKAAQVAGSAATVATKAGEATAVVSANAAEAASGAAASQAPIPIIGPGLAIAAFAGVMAMVMGAMGSIKSASQGFDIPSGVNPLTQLHEEEMVLPAPLANGVRDMVSNGAAPAPVMPTFNATPLKGGFWIAHEDEFRRFFKGMQRDGKL